nr:iron ABC transporter permease [uncultured Bacillus sp.]
MPKRYIRKFLNNKGTAFCFAGAFLIISMLSAISIGTVHVPIWEIIQIVGGEIFRFSPDQIDPMYTNIVLNIRVPRVLLAGLVGASLAIAGAAFQGLLRNPLADPYTLGVSSGASVGAVITLFLHLSFPLIGSLTLPFMSVICSLLTIVLVLFFAQKIDQSMKVETIILTGIIFSSFLGAFISLMIALTGDELRMIINWLLGSVSMRGWDYIKIMFPFFATGSILLLFNASELNAMAFGEERAQYLGVNVKKRKLMILTAGSILTGAAVSVSGTIGFVGLVIPHLTRLLWGPDHKYLLPLSILTGAGFLILADLTARTIISPSELPIGVITAIIGAPVFGLILLRSKRKERGA